MLGSVVGIFGVRGELKIAPTSIGGDTLAAGLRVTLRATDGSQRQENIARARAHKRGAIVALAGIDRAEAAEALIGSSIWTARENVNLSDGEYLDEDLIGCRVVQDGRTLGAVAAVRHYPAQDVLELDGGGMIPMVRAFVQRIDVAARIIGVDLPAGLVEGEPL